MLDNFCCVTTRQTQPESKLGAFSRSLRGLKTASDDKNTMCDTKIELISEDSRHLMMTPAWAGSRKSLFLLLIFTFLPSIFQVDNLQKSLKEIPSGSDTPVIQAKLVQVKELEEEVRPEIEKETFCCLLAGKKNRPDVVCCRGSEGNSQNLV